MKDHAFSYYVAIDFKKKNVNSIFGCNKEHVRYVEENPVLPSQIELGVGNNFVEMFFPYQWSSNLVDYFNRLLPSMGDEI
jgi:hypothetical protein